MPKRENIWGFRKDFKIVDGGPTIIPLDSFQLLRVELDKPDSLSFFISIQPYSALAAFLAGAIFNVSFGSRTSTLKVPVLPETFNTVFGDNLRIELILPNATTITSDFSITGFASRSRSNPSLAIAPSSGLPPFNPAEYSMILAQDILTGLFAPVKLSENFLEVFNRPLAVAQTVEVITAVPGATTWGAINYDLENNSGDAENYASVSFFVINATATVLITGVQFRLCAQAGGGPPQATGENILIPPALNADEFFVNLDGSFAGPARKSIRGFKSVNVGITLAAGVGNQAVNVTGMLTKG